MMNPKTEKNWTLIEAMEELQKIYDSGGSGQKEIRVHRIKFPKFFQEQLYEMDRHWPEKGDGWKDMSPGDLMVLFDKVTLVLHQRYSVGDVGGVVSQTIDVANILAMLHTNVKEGGI